jgi:hypothetical protein
MRPQTWLLLMQPQVRFPNSICAHFLACLLRLTIFVCNASISNGVYNMHTLLAHFPRQSLRQLANGCATCTVCRELSATAQGTESTGEYQSLHLRS